MTNKNKLPEIAGGLLKVGKHYDVLKHGEWRIGAFNKMKIEHCQMHGDRSYIYSFFDVIKGEQQKTKFYLDLDQGEKLNKSIRNDK